MATIKTLRRSRAQTKGTDQGYRPRAQTVRFGLDPRNVDQSSKIKIARGIWQTGNTDQQTMNTFPRRLNGAIVYWRFILASRTLSSSNTVKIVSTSRMPHCCHRASGTYSGSVRLYFILVVVLAMHSTVERWLPRGTTFSPHRAKWTHKDIEPRA